VLDSWAPNIFRGTAFHWQRCANEGARRGYQPHPLNQQTGNDEDLGNRGQYRGTPKFDIIANPGGTRCPAQ